MNAFSPRLLVREAEKAPQSDALWWPNKYHDRFAAMQGEHRMSWMPPLFRLLFQIFWPSVLTVLVFAPVGVFLNRVNGFRSLLVAAVLAWLVSWTAYWLLYRVTSAYGIGLLRDQLILTGLVAWLPLLVASTTIYLLARQGSTPWIQIVLSALVGSLTMPFLGVLFGLLQYLRTGSWL